MAYTRIQTLRNMRAKNKGSNRRIAARLRDISGWLDKKGPEEFTRREANQLRALRDMLTQRLYANVLTQATQDNLDGKHKTRYEY